MLLDGIAGILVDLEFVVFGADFSGVWSVLE